MSKIEQIGLFSFVISILNEDQYFYSERYTNDLLTYC